MGEIASRSWLDTLLPDSPGRAPVSSQVADEYFTIKEYELAWPGFSDLGLHMIALNRLGETTRQKTGRSIAIYEREALLVFSLWTEDPLKAIEFAQSVGFSESEVNQYVDDVQNKFEDNGNRILDGLIEVRETWSPSESPSEVDAEVEISPDYQHRQDEIEREARSSRKHPILTKEQEVIFIHYLKEGLSVSELLQDPAFTRTVKPEDIAKFERIFNHSNSVEEALLACNFGLVAAIARRIHGLPFQDRIDEGNMGLLRAALKWNPEAETKFSSFAAWWIRASIQRATYDGGLPIRLPVHVHEDLGKIRKVNRAFKMTLGRSPTLQELRQQLIVNSNLSISRIDTALGVIRARLFSVLSIQEGSEKDEDWNLEARLSDRTVDVEANAIQNVEIEELGQEIKLAMEEDLTPEEQTVIKSLFGIGGETERNIWELMTELSLSYTEIEDIRGRGLGKLSQNKRLISRWEDDAPTLIFHTSAENAAFRLGLFDEPLRATRAETSLQDTNLVFEDEPVDQSNDAFSEQVRVKQLRNQGHSNWEIAGMLGIPFHKVGKHISALLAAGEIIRRPLGRKSSMKIPVIEEPKEKIDRESFKSKETELVRQYLSENSFNSTIRRRKPF